MNILVTAGNTLVPIDRVRCITNIFTGRTGAQIARHGHALGHSVTLLTSHPDTASILRPDGTELPERCRVLSYRTFDELHDRMAELIRGADLDVVIHSAAVSDFRTAGVYAPNGHTRFETESGQWESTGTAAPGLVDVSAGKVKSDAPELWLRLARTPKLIDLVRADWGFHGRLVKFKLEVGVTETALLEIAERSRRHSAADLMVANTLDGASHWAYVGPIAGQYRRVGRKEMPACLFDALDRLNEE
jgi:phosphopantothenoylcysteine synthetase/decarboxylase